MRGAISPALAPDQAPRAVPAARKCRELGLGGAGGARLYGARVLAFPWLVALKVIPWGDVIEHAPKVLTAARQLVDRQRRRPAEAPPPAPPPLPADTPPEVATLAGELAAQREELRRVQQTQEALTQTVADLAEQNTRLVEAVELLRRRTRLLLAVAALLGLALVWVAAR